MLDLSIGGPSEKEFRFEGKVYKMPTTLLSGRACEALRGHLEQEAAKLAMSYVKMAAEARNDREANDILIMAQAKTAQATDTNYMDSLRIPERLAVVLATEMKDQGVDAETARKMCVECQNFVAFSSLAISCSGVEQAKNSGGPDQ